MPFDSSGNFSLVPGYLATSGQTILTSQHNGPFEDVASGLSQVILRSGVAPFGGNQSMGGFKITNAANGSAAGDYTNFAQLTDVIAQITAVAASVTAVAVPTGAVQGFRRTTAPAGWIKENGGTIGNPTSGATTRANADTQPLFELLWGQFDNTTLPIQTNGGVATTRGASAAADFAANKRMPLFDHRAEFERGADDGRGVDATLTVGKSQLDAIQNITGGFTTRRTAVVNTEDIADWAGAFFDDGLGGTDLAVDVSSPVARRKTGFNASLVVRTATETRPRSTTTLRCIKL